MYKTGDLGRYLPDGSIQFLGRLDQQRQVKMRGYRIELGEIEAVLSSHAAVERAVVLLREDHPGDPYLAAYILPAQGQPMAASELRSFLKAKLPDYMVPAAFVVLEALPMTATGKLDRRSLPSPTWARDEEEGAVAAPRTRVERLVAEILADVLGREQVGVHDNLFDLGGHSLLVIRVLSRIRSVFAVELPLRSLFERPTVAGLAECVEQTASTIDRLQAPVHGDPGEREELDL
jgi:acyl carrier protein